MDKDKIKNKEDLMADYRCAHNYRLCTKYKFEEANKSGHTSQSKTDKVSFRSDNDCSRRFELNPSKCSILAWYLLMERLIEKFR